jgi:DNA-directed RNA polymerase specialized sigma24 family protein
MTAAVTPQVRCDVLLCAATCVGEVGETIANLREQAAAQGWQYLARDVVALDLQPAEGRGAQSHVDICPAHQGARRYSLSAAAIHQARERRAAILHMAEAEGKTHSQLGQALGISRARVEQLLRSARSQREGEMRRRSPDA